MNSDSNHNKSLNGCIKTKIIKTNAEFDNLNTDWEVLCENADVHIFQTYEWQRIWWEYYGEGKQLNLILFYQYNNEKNDCEKLIGIAPFFIDEKFAGGVKILCRYRLIGSGVEGSQSKQNIDEYGVSDYLDLIIHKGFEGKIVETLAEYFRNNYSDYDMIQLDTVAENSSIFKFFVPLLSDANWHYKIDKKDICPRVVLPENIDEYFNQINPKVRNKFKKIRRDTVNPLFKISKVKSEYELVKSFHDFVRLHQKRWNNLGLTGLFSDDKYKQFLKDIAHAFLLKDMLYFTTLNSDNKCISAEFAFKYKKNYYDYLKAFDDESPLTKYKPGKLLLLALIEEAIENKSETVDMLRGGETYKFDFTDTSQLVYKVTIKNPFKHYSYRLLFFLMMMTFLRFKRRAANEFSFMAAQFKNYGLTKFILHYIPARAGKITNKLHSHFLGAGDIKKHRKEIPT